MSFQAGYSDYATPGIHQLAPNDSSEKSIPHIEVVQ